MHGPMGWSHHPMAFHGKSQMHVPLIPAPVAFMAGLVGVMIGLMIGKHSSMMHGMGHGMGHGMMHGRGCCGDDRGWDMDDEMGGMAAHHHHGTGAPACVCERGNDEE